MMRDSVGEVDTIMERIIHRYLLPPDKIQQFHQLVSMEQEVIYAIISIWRASRTFSIQKIKKTYIKLLQSVELIPVILSDQVVETQSRNFVIL